MKIQFLATADAPDYYTFEEEIVSFVYDEKMESIDLSDFDIGDRFNEIELDILSLRGSHIIRDIERRQDGNLYLTLCQKSSEGHWAESDWMDSKNYKKDTVYIQEVNDGEIK